MDQTSIAPDAIDAMHKAKTDISSGSKA